MGVLNVTPDSFSDGARYLRASAAVRHAHELTRAGADIIDIGGESTRPGADPVDPRLETARILPVVTAVAAAGITVSVDTMHATTARAALQAGARIVNDVSGGLADPDMHAVVAESGAQYVLGHLRGTPRTMNEHAHYDDVTAELAAELSQRIRAARAAGIEANRIVVDPGLGFAKAAEHNWTLLRNLTALTALGHPLMVGASRKRFLSSLLPSEASTADRDLPTALLSALLAERGVNALRVHDVTATRIALDMVRFLLPPGGIGLERASSDRVESSHIPDDAHDRRRGEQRSHR
ncbi:dihydropteroate synthase [Streptomyces griseorubiginosus]|uniref:dihydropteroate synthase n=1 Tax=Streptomyces griseorubiginosus TaxID=67304 RepID=UPI0027E2A152|nr:dihydropteroate synthase [Streptomyces griseorubiginosus]